MIGNDFQFLSSGRTDENGRFSNFVDNSTDFNVGRYRIRFLTGIYFTSHVMTSGIFPFVDVRIIFDYNFIILINYIYFVIQGHNRYFKACYSLSHSTNIITVFLLYLQRHLNRLFEEGKLFFIYS